MGAFVMLGQMAPQINREVATFIPKNLAFAATGLVEEAALEGFANFVGKVGKAINLPSWRRVAIDMEEVVSGHTAGGARLRPNSRKTLFPSGMTETQIERAIRQAYRYGSKVGSPRRRESPDGGRIKRPGHSDVAEQDDENHRDRVPCNQMTGASGDSARFSVIVDPVSLSQSRRGQTSGTIYALLDGYPFPEPEWSDLVVAVLHGWMVDLVAFCRGNSDAVRLHFMDGPFALEVRRLQAGRYRLSCLRLPSAVEFFAEDFVFRDVMTAFVGAATRLIDECDRRGWSSRDIVELRLARTALSDLNTTA